ncbi:hypothetical protein [Chitinophaga defluvii]|uniref:Uncharacterized protein n=1 Tax=Chitinophaga defluvii TaxID=3163343 RepID=A0ABV2T157_9BACT
MKWFSSLMAILVLFLAVQPVCANMPAADTCCSVAATECCKDQPAQQPVEANNHSSQEDCDSGCNPFQLCNCCAFSVLTLHPSPFLSYIHFNIPQWGIPLIHFSEAPVSGFWQPPRIA